MALVAFFLLDALVSLVYQMVPFACRFVLYFERKKVSGQTPQIAGRPVEVLVVGAP